MTAMSETLDRPAERDERTGDVALTAWQVAYEQRAFWRNRTRAFFSFGVPVMLLLLFGALNSRGRIRELGDIPYIGALFRYETRNRKRTNLMVFLRPYVLKDEKSAAALTQDRYDYIRNQQGTVTLPPSLIMPKDTFEPMPPLEQQMKQPLGIQ